MACADLLLELEIRKDDFMVDIIWDVVECFIENWRNSPYKWLTEIDIQSEIASRLRQALKDRDKLYQEAKYDYIRNGKMQKYSRVCCEWSTNYDNSQGIRGCCFPDVIISDDIADPNNPPDQNKYRNWPMLWVCEIKYNTEDNSTLKGEWKWDIEKLGYLLEQNETKYACGLYFDRTKIDVKPICPTKEKNDRFRNYIIWPKK